MAAWHASQSSARGPGERRSPHTRRGSGTRSTMWALEPEVAEEITHPRTPTRVFLPGIALPETIRASHDVAAAVARRRGRDPGAAVVAPARRVAKRRAVAAAATPSSWSRPRASRRAASAHVARCSRETMPDARAGAPRVPLRARASRTRSRSGLPTDVVVASTGMMAARQLQPLMHSPRSASTRAPIRSACRSAARSRT